jgi:hypothetical protein
MNIVDSDEAEIVLVIYCEECLWAVRLSAQLFCDRMVVGDIVGFLKGFEFFVCC